MFTITTITLAAALAQAPEQPAATEATTTKPAATAAPAEQAPAANAQPSMPAEPPAPIAYEPPALSPQSPPIPPELAQLMKDVRWQWNLVQSYQAETDIEPGGLTDPEKMAMVGILQAIAAEKWDEALALLRPNLTDTSNPAFDFTLGNVFFQREQLDDAATMYRRTVEKFPKFRRAWKNLGMIHVRKSEFPQAIEALQKVVELGGEDSVTFGLLGYCYGNTDNPLGAESAYRHAILLDPKTKDWKLGLARAFFKQGRYPDAITLTGDLIAQNPEAVDLWMLQANAYLGSNQAMKAAQNYEIVDRLGKPTIETLNMCGDIYVNEGLYADAVRCYSRAMEMTPRGPAERGIRACRVLIARQANEESESLISAMERIYGNDLSANERKDLLKLRSRLAVAKGAGEEEAKVLAEIVALDPMDGEALILLGQYHQRTGDPDRAVFNYEAAAKIEKFEADAKVRHAQLLVSQGKYAEALPLLRAAQQVKPRENIQSYLDQVERVAKQRGAAAGAGG